MTPIVSLAAGAACAAAVSFTLVAVSAQNSQERTSAEVHRNALRREPAPDGAVSRLRVPAGFRVSVFARGLTDPRMLEVDGDGVVYVTRWKTGDVIALRDTNGDGTADQQTTVAQLAGVHGLDLLGSTLYYASATEIWTVGVALGQPTTAPRLLVSGLPDGGQHPNRVIQFGPDNLLYVSVGSSCNDCAESNQLERGTFLRYTPDGQRRDVFAKGLRNSIGFDWHPTTGELWAMDNGNDYHGDEIPPEELNRVEPGRHYGWPICYGPRIVDSRTHARPEDNALRPGDAQPLRQPMTRQEFCAQTEPSVLTYTAHAAPIWMQFYEHDQFAGYRGDAFVAFHGSWNRKSPVGFRVARLRFQGDQPRGFEPFMSGFADDDGDSYVGRPAGLAVARDGSLLVSDDANGVIYRVSYGGS